MYVCLLYGTHLLQPVLLLLAVPLLVLLCRLYLVIMYACQVLHDHTVLIVQILHTLHGRHRLLLPNVTQQAQQMSQTS